MREVTKAGMAAAVTLVLAAGAARAQDEKSWSFDAGVDYSSKYLFRGVTLLGDNEVWVPHASFGVGGLSIGYYGYIGDIPEGGSYRENDLNIDYTFDIGDKFSLTLGGVAYLYNGDAETDLGFLDTEEVYALASWDVFLAPTITYYHDIDEVDGGFLTLGVSHDIAFSDQVSLSLSGTLGIDFGYNLNGAYADDLGVSKSNGDLDDFLAGADLSWQITDNFGAHVLVQRSIALKVLDDIGQDDVTVVTGGLSLSF